MRVGGHMRVVGLWISSLGFCLGLGCSDVVISGEAALMDVYPTQLSFDPAPIGCDGDIMQFAVMNRGNAILQFNVEAINSPSEAFHFDGEHVTGSYALGPDSTLNFSVAFAPTGAENSGLIAIEATGGVDTDHGDLDVQIDLSGAGTGDQDGDGFAESCGDCDDSENDAYPGGEEVCDGIDNDCDGVIPSDEEDGDEDGWFGCEDDCDDGDPSIHPSADELCDGLDNDCDGSPGVDEVDADGDGYLACDDCDDADADTWPGAIEICDGLDNDCDGSPGADEIDGDGDGFLACNDCDDAAANVNPDELEACDGLDNDCDGSPGADEVDADGDGYLACDDCDDSNTDTWPGATEICDGLDNDCDGNPGTDEVDGDGDGHLACDDCDDVNADTYPMASELCDGLDNDCDGSVPADEADADVDGVRICDGDCDDWDADTHPGATELCDDLDNDCDGLLSESETDDDGDGYDECADGDCDDSSSDVFPGATEYCNEIDDDCDGVTDEDDAADADVWYYDGDGDGYGDYGDTTEACDTPTDYVSDSTDCDDDDAGVHPNASEYCNGIDDDCDGDEDEDAAVDVETWYEDDDGDGYGDASSTDVDCDQPSGYVNNSSDCDDADDYAYPGAFEYCDGVDNDCDGEIDGLSEITLLGNILADSDLGECPGDYCAWGAYDREFWGTGVCANDPWAAEYSGWGSFAVYGTVFYTDHSCFGYDVNGTYTGIQSTLFQYITSLDDFDAYYVMEVDYLSYASTPGNLSLGTGMPDWAAACNWCSFEPTANGAWQHGSCGPVYVSAASILTCPIFQAIQDPTIAGGTMSIDNIEMVECLGRP